MATTRSIKRPRKKKAAINILPEFMQAFIARRLIDTIALFFALFGSFTLIALVSYDRQDPSWNTANSASENILAIQNWGGANGAWLADLLIQSIGIASFAIGIAMLTWGIRLYHRQAIRPFTLRLTALMLATLSGAVAFSQISAGEWFPHPFLGGAIGTLIIGTLNEITLKFLPIARVLLIPLSTVITLTTLLYAMAVSKEELHKALQFTQNLIITAIFAAYNIAVTFTNWVRHHNDPAHYQPRALKKLTFTWPKIKLKRPAPKVTNIQKATPAPSPSTPAPAPVPTPQEPAPQQASSNRFAATANALHIPVVAPETAVQNSNSQARFNLPEGEWSLPDIALLEPAPAPDQSAQLDEKALRRNAELLQNVLADFKIEGDIVSIHPGPVVTLYEFEPAPGTKSSKIIALADDIARSMSAVSVRCAVVPGRNVIGIELPNKSRQFVYMSELLSSSLYQKTKTHLPLILGKDIGGQPMLADLAKMPHLLVAGTTGSGKSVAVNTMILSLLYRLPPEKCRMIMIDPKMLELSVYDGIPHLLSPVVTEPGKAVVALKWTVQEMEERYRAMSKLGVRNIEGYNERIREAIKKGETIMHKVQTGFNPEDGKPTFEEREMDLVELPYIVVVVDEFADLMLVAGKDVENAIQRLAQMARAAGIHLIMATQRPSVDVITGVVKANFPTRISFQVTSKIDSRTILGDGGAEQLLGMGDMLYMAPGGRITRVHGPFVSDTDVEKVVNTLKAQGEPTYIDTITSGEGDFGDNEVMNAMFGESGGSDGSKVDELYDEAVAIIAREGKASTSFIQRHLQIGYNRAARIIEEMERQGVVSPANAVGKRNVLIQSFDGGQAERV